ncbi:hypothetical protein QQG55_22625 [Brugia pahangi]
MFSNHLKCYVRAVPASRDTYQTVQRQYVKKHPQRCTPLSLCRQLCTTSTTHPYSYTQLKSCWSNYIFFERI